MWLEKLRNPPAVRLILAVGLLATVFGALNATLIFDDPFLYEHFGNTLVTAGFFKTIGILFLNLDLHAGVPEYRTYGISKVLHFLLWLVLDSAPWKYSALIGLSQTATAVLIHFLIRRAGGNPLQALLAALVWVLSPFAVTTCFHHYSYLILPVQITLVVAFWLQGLLLRGGWKLLRTGPLLILAGGLMVLTGEQHLALSAALLGLVVFKTPSTMAFKPRLWSFLLVGAAGLVALAAHRKIWSLLGPVVDVHRFNYAEPSLTDFFQRSVDYVYSLPRGAFAQIIQILSYSTSSALMFVVLLSMLSFALHRFVLVRGGMLWAENVRASAEPEPQVPAVSWFGVFAWLVVAALTVVWIRAVFFSATGEILPRRYGYVPYTLVCMALVVHFSGAVFRKHYGTLPALTVAGGVMALWGSLQFVCLPQVRSQDEVVWGKIREAVQEKKTPYVLFVNPLNIQGPTGLDARGIRSVTFPPLFESPFMRFGWQGQYVKTALNVAGTGDAFEPASDGRVTLTGQLAGIHFQKSAPLTVAEESVVVVTDTGFTPLLWNEGVERVKVLRSWAEFENTAAYVRMRAETGWGNLLAGVFNDPRDEVAIDLGQRAKSEVPGLLADKSFNTDAQSNSMLANYGLESGNDSVYAPNGRAGAPLSYLTTNRHGAFTYRIDFLDSSPKLVSIDFLDVWADSAGFRVMVLQVAFDDKWHDLGKVDVYALSKKEPLSIKLPVAGVKSLRIRLTASASSKDIPFANGIRIRSLTAR